MNMVEIEILDATAELVAPFGDLITKPKEQPDKSGSNWKCWIPLATVDLSQGQLQFGMVTARTEGAILISEMERHEKRQEILWPIDNPIIQLMGVPESLEDPLAKPSIKKICALRIYPGQILIMRKGAWHAPAYAENREASYFYAIEKTNIPEKDIQPWKPFSGNETVKLV